MIRKPFVTEAGWNAVAQERVRQTIRERVIPNQTSYYALLGLHPSASPLEIRRAYWKLSKCYHPDTTDLPAATATAKFQQLNEAYATLSNPERRIAYDQKIDYSRLHVIQPPSNLNTPVSQARKAYSSSAYLDPTDRPLSAGEIFALFILGLTFVGCLLLAIAIGLTRGEAAFQVSPTSSNGLPKQQQLSPHQAKTPVSLEFELLSAEPMAIASAPTIPELREPSREHPVFANIRPQAGSLWLRKQSLPSSVISSPRRRPTLHRTHKSEGLCSRDFSRSCVLLALGCTRRAILVGEDTPA